jgi:hypothetical protein
LISSVLTGSREGQDIPLALYKTISIFVESISKVHLEGIIG